MKALVIRALYLAILYGYTYCLASTIRVYVRPNFQPNDSEGKGTIENPFSDLSSAFTEIKKIPDSDQSIVEFYLYSDPSHLIPFKPSHDDVNFKFSHVIFDHYGDEKRPKLVFEGLNSKAFNITSRTVVWKNLELVFNMTENSGTAFMVHAEDKIVFQNITISQTNTHQNSSIKDALFELGGPSNVYFKNIFILDQKLTGLCKIEANTLSVHQLFLSGSEVENPLFIASVKSFIELSQISVLSSHVSQEGELFSIKLGLNTSMWSISDFKIENNTILGHIFSLENRPLNNGNLQRIQIINNSIQQTNLFRVLQKHNTIQFNNFKLVSNKFRNSSIIRSEACESSHLYEWDMYQNDITTNQLIDLRSNNSRILSMNIEDNLIKGLSQPGLLLNSKNMSIGFFEVRNNTITDVTLFKGSGRGFEYFDLSRTSFQKNILTRSSILEVYKYQSSSISSCVIEQNKFLFSTLYKFQKLKNLTLEKDVLMHINGINYTLFDISNVKGFSAKTVSLNDIQIMQKDEKHLISIDNCSCSLSDVIISNIKISENSPLIKVNNSLFKMNMSQIVNINENIIEPNSRIFDLQNSNLSFFNSNFERLNVDHFLNQEGRLLMEIRNSSFKDIIIQKYFFGIFDSKKHEALNFLNLTDVQLENIWYSKTSSKFIYLDKSVKLQSR